MRHGRGDRFTVTNSSQFTPADVVAQVGAVLGAGARRVEFGTPHGLDSLHGIELLGWAVLPEFRS